MTAQIIQVGSTQVANHLPFVLFGGMNVLESRELVLVALGQQLLDGFRFFAGDFQT